MKTDERSSIGSEEGTLLLAPLTPQTIKEYYKPLKDHKFSNLDKTDQLLERHKLLPKLTKEETQVVCHSQLQASNARLTHPSVWFTARPD